MLKVNYISEQNLDAFYLAQHVEFKASGTELWLYNSLFDSVLLASMKTEQAVFDFVSSLENGVADIIGLIEKCFSQNPDDVFKLLVQKKIIE